MPGMVMIGAGPGLGLSIARRFAREGLPIALVARSENKLKSVAGALARFGVPVVALRADSADEFALRSALDAASEKIGVPDVVVYNAAIIQPDLPGELSVRAHQKAWAVNVVGAITAAAHVVPAMARRGSGSFIITGGMPEPEPEYVSLSLGKAGVRALVTLLDKRYGPVGVHVATVTVDGRSRRAAPSIPTPSRNTTGGCTPRRCTSGNGRSSTASTSPAGKPALTIEHLVS